MPKRSIAIFAALVWLAHGLAAVEVPPGCGTHAEKASEQLAFHRRAALARAKSGLRPLVATTGRARDIGEIAVIDDAGDIVAQPAVFDLSAATVSFLPLSGDAARYRFETGAASYDPGAAAAGARLNALADDDTRAVALPFSFPFYGSSYANLYVNSDGNLTFIAPDTVASARSLGRLAAGPPRIAPFFRDLDPSRSPAGVTVLASSERFVVSWIAVPQFAASGSAPVQTFQVRLFPSGRIEFAFADAGSPAAVVGISPGGMQGSTAVVSFREDASADYSGAVAESFAASREVDIHAAALRFYQNHDDAYDYLVMFNTMGVAAAPGALAYEVTARSLNRTGYGRTRVDAGSLFGSPRRLQAVLNMGPVSQYPASPDGVMPNRGQVTGDTGLTILGHEAGHLFLAFASARNPLDYQDRVMLKPDGAHWSYNFNSDASLLEGNRIRDNGDGTFTTTGTVKGFSAFDQYLMGLVSPSEVPPQFVVANSSISADTPSSARSTTFLGKRLNIGVDQMVQTEGLRAPGPAASQRRFRFAFILIVAAGNNPDDLDLQKLEDYRGRLEDGFSQWTGSRASAETTLRRGVQLSLAPSAGVVMGSTVTATVSIARPSTGVLTLTLERAQAAAYSSFPESVTIPAGATGSSFQITGLAEGVEELVARPSDPAYETATARVLILPAPSSLRLTLVADRDPIQLRVTDLDNTPYAGIRVLADTFPSGAVSDADGLVSLPRGAATQVAFRIDGATPLVFDGIVNAASYAPGPSPGGFAAIFGQAIGGSVRAGLPPYPRELGDVQVWIDGLPAGLHYASDRQVNLVVPTAAQEGTRNLFVSSAGGSAMLIRTPVLAASPGIFAAVRNSNFLEIYCTGLGSGLPVTVLLGGRPLTPSFSGSHPSFPGLYQVNVQIPGDLAGDQPLSIEVSSRRSNEIRVGL